MKEINYKCTAESTKVERIKNVPFALYGDFSQAPKRCNCISCKRLKVRRNANAR